MNFKGSIDKLDKVRELLDCSVEYKDCKHQILVSALKELIRIIEAEGMTASRDRRKAWLKAIHFIANDML